MKDAWTPGTPILTSSDLQAWQVWRRTRILAAQRTRRAQMRRIDYYPTDEAAEIISQALRSSSDSAERNYGATISRIVAEWAAFRNKIGANIES